MNLLNSVFPEGSPDESKIDAFKNLINKNSQSFLLNFPSIPFSEVIYGCSEANAQFTYGHSPDFDKNLLNVGIKFFV